MECADFWCTEESAHFRNKGRAMCSPFSISLTSTPLNSGIAFAVCHSSYGNLGSRLHH